MPNDEPTIEPAAGAGVPEHAATVQETAVQAPGTLAYEPVAEEDDGWLDEPEELPRRPRRRLLAPIPIALLIVLLTACGFIGGVLVEKGQGSSSSSTSGTGAAGLAARFAALRGGSAGSGAGAKSGAAGGGLFGAGGASSAGTAAGATTGQVAYVQGGTLYVTTAEGNTVKVTTSKASTVTKTVKAAVSAIRPGETVLVTGAAGTNGAVSAESIRVGASAGGGGLAGLFGRSGAGGGGSGSSGGGGGEPALFGKGG
jgi:hypothetical protein